MKALLAKQKMINKVVLIPEHRIKPNPYQPRRVFDQEKIEQLAASIAQYGLLQPITVLPLEDTAATSWWRGRGGCWPAAGCVCRRCPPS